MSATAPEDAADKMPADINAGAERTFGCPRCRWAARGCLTCRVPGYRYRGSRGRPKEA